MATVGAPRCARSAEPRGNRTPLRVRPSQSSSRPGIFMGVSPQSRSPRACWSATALSLFALTTLGLPGCASPSPVHASVGVTSLLLSSCDDPERTVRVPAGSPVALLTHGTRAQPDGFAPLARAMRAADEWKPQSERRVVACFRYGQGTRLTDAAAALRRLLSRLDQHGTPRVLVLGHSLGGLVARRALVSNRRWPALRARVSLVTIATPFAGVAAAHACGDVLLRVMSLGVASLVCRREARGSRWRDIHSRARLITQPGVLGPWVVGHLNLVTLEHGQCRTRAPSGACQSSDAVFRPDEQVNAAIADPRMITRTFRAGHAGAIQELGALSRLVALLESR